MRASSSIIDYIDFIYLAATVYACNLNRVQLHVLDETMRRRTTLLHIATNIVIFIFFVKLLLIFVLAVFRLLRYFHIFFRIRIHFVNTLNLSLEIFRSIHSFFIVVVARFVLNNKLWLQVNWRSWDFDQWTEPTKLLLYLSFSFTHTHAHIPSCLQLVKNKSVQLSLVWFGLGLVGLGCGKSHYCGY